MKTVSPTSHRETILAVSLVVLSTLITYGALVSQLGFYRDDWYLLWTAESQGPQGILNLFRGDRPFVGWLYQWDFSMLGTSALGWHLYVLFIKIASALAFLWLVRTIWPERKLETTFATLLFVVYPGFYQQPNALTFKQLLLAYMAVLFSLSFSVQAIMSDRMARRVLYTILAVLLGVFYILIYEALVGMEVVRLLLIWYLLRQSTANWRETIRGVILKAIPYLIFATGFTLWRILIFQSTRRATDINSIVAGYTNLHGFIRIFFELLKDLLETSILAWGIPFYQFAVGSIYKDLGLALGLGILIVAISAGYYFLARKQMGLDEAGKEAFSYDWLVLGIAIIFVTTVPIVLAGRNVIFGIQWDRYTYQSVFGVALFIGGFVFYALRGNIRWIVLALLLISGVSTQIFSGIFYRDFWMAEREAWWQLYWRAPQITEGTTVIASLPGGYQFAEEYEVWGPLNLVYHDGGSLMIPGQVMMDRLAIDLEHGTIEDRIVRGTVAVTRDYNRSLLIAMPSTFSCLHVYNGELPIVSLSDPIIVRLAASHSDIDLIKTNVPSPTAPEWILGEEPDHGWCFYYQKINLSLQSGQWAEAAQLADEARSADLQPKDVIEWMTPLQAYANIGDSKKAKQVSTFINDKYTRLYLCQQLETITEWPDGYRSDLILKYLCKAD